MWRKIVGGILVDGVDEVLTVDFNLSTPESAENNNDIVILG